MANEYLIWDDEIWKAIPGYEGYEVSDLGRVRSLNRLILHKTGRRTGMLIPRIGKILRQFKNTQGYFVVVLGQPPQKSVHRLVALAFLGEIPYGHHVCHANGDPVDNRLSNLRIDTPDGNARDSQRHGTRVRGERAWNCRLTLKQVIEIRKSERERRDLHKKWKAIRQIALGHRWKWLDVKDP